MAHTWQTICPVCRTWLNRPKKLIQRAIVVCIIFNFVLFLRIPRQQKHKYSEDVIGKPSSLFGNEVETKIEIQPYSKGRISRKRKNQIERQSRSGSHAQLRTITQPGRKFKRKTNKGIQKFSETQTSIQDQSQPPKTALEYEAQTEGRANGQSETRTETQIQNSLAMEHKLSTHERPRKGETLQTDKSYCPKMTIHGEEESHEIAQLKKSTACRPHLPAEDACKYTAQLFAAVPGIATCHDQKEPPYELCKISERHRKNEPVTLKVKCDLSACNRRHPVRIEIVGPSNGGMWFLDLPGTISNRDMEREVVYAAEKTRGNNFNFLFLDCTDWKHGKNISQLLTLLPDEKILKRDQKVSAKKVNVNVVLLDSISRPHFYRSLPKTVEYLREKQAEPDYHAHIFDFELFQSVHGHTHENEHALFSGSLYPENCTKEEKESSPTNMEVLFGVFKNSGYQTMALNDMCWTSHFGLIHGFMAGSWSTLQKKLKDANIDSTGITDASCKILGSYSKRTSFNDDTGHQICFNGKHHHKHQFDYLTKYLKAVSRMPESKPLFSYTETNVAHDDIGVRVQTLDGDLRDLIDSVARQSNTMTIFFADHGNTYTEYQVAMLEGRFEMYHPVLLAILPKQLGEKFGHEIITNLKTNQYRLLNLFDVRAGLVELATYDARSKLKPAGILGKISKERTCDDLKLSSPNFCICEGRDTPVENTTAQLALAEFGIGQMNNQIQQSLLAARGDAQPPDHHVIFGACQRLRIRSITNVRQRQTAEGTLVTTLDVTVQSGNIVDQKELFMLQVESNQRSEKSSFEMKLVSFNRISKYSVHKQCSDPGVELNLCVCSKPGRNSHKKKPTLNFVYSMVGNNAEIHEVQPCLLLIKRTTKENKGREDFVGMEVYEMANICGDREFTVTLNAETNNARPATELPIDVVLKPKTMHFLTVVMNEVGYIKSSLKLRFSIVTEDFEEE